MSTDTVKGTGGLSGGDPLFGNKIAAGVLVPMLLVVALNVFSGIIYTPKKPAVAGYDLPQPAPVAEPGAADQATQAEPLPIRLASADATKGQAAAKKCLACHIFDKGGPNKIGPNLYGVVGRPKGSHEGFSYSGAMKGKGGEWSYDNLDQFLANPKGYVTGTIMAFAGVQNPKERADILAFLRTLSDSPVPFPEAAAAPAPAPGGAPPADGTKTQGASGTGGQPAPQAAAPQPADPSKQVQPSTQNQPQPPATGASPGGAPSASGSPNSPASQAPAASQPSSPPGTATPAHQ